MKKTNAKICSTALITVMTTLFFHANANAGFFGLTHFSRANCLNNESISWDNSKSQKMYVSSTHRWITDTPYQVHLQHTIASGWQTVPAGGNPFDGAKAIHWGEGITQLPGGNRWYVEGRHTYKYLYFWGYANNTVRSAAVGCDLTDGYTWVD